MNPNTRTILNPTRVRMTEVGRALPVPYGGYVADTRMTTDAVPFLMRGRHTHTSVALRTDLTAAFRRSCKFFQIIRWFQLHNVCIGRQ